MRRTIDIDRSSRKEKSFGLLWWRQEWESEHSYGNGSTSIWRKKILLSHLSQEYSKVSVSWNFYLNFTNTAISLTIFIVILHIASGWIFFLSVIENESDIWRVHIFIIIPRRARNVSEFITQITVLKFLFSFDKGTNISALHSKPSPIESRK